MPGAWLLPNTLAEKSIYHCPAFLEVNRTIIVVRRRRNRWQRQWLAVALALASAAFVVANLQPTMKLYFHILQKVASFPQDYGLHRQKGGQGR
jgi:hypothetical protein